jgi:hypothetical protein
MQKNIKKKNGWERVTLTPLYVIGLIIIESLLYFLFEKTRKNMNKKI